MMNLERIEQKCLDYLMKVTRPLVSIATLAARLREDDDECGGLSERDLTDFLRKHELFRVIDSEEALDGIDSGPRVILVSRIPTAPEMSVMMKEQMKKMTDALASAQAEAARNADTETLAKIANVMKRAETLAKRLEELS